jgi:hypothetical protein
MPAQKQRMAEKKYAFPGILNLFIDLNAAETG